MGEGGGGLVYAIKLMNNVSMLEFLYLINVPNSVVLRCHFLCFFVVSFFCLAS